MQWFQSNAIIVNTFLNVLMIRKKPIIVQKTNFKEQRGYYVRPYRKPYSHIPVYRDIGVVGSKHLNRRNIKMPNPNEIPSQEIIDLLKEEEEKAQKRMSKEERKAFEKQREKDYLRWHNDLTRAFEDMDKQEGNKNLKR